jgi:hypothetical protein
MGARDDEGIVLSRMALADQSPVPGGSPRCAHCGAVVGVYERATVVVGELVRTTSRAADPGLSSDVPGSLYHASCYELARAEPGA